MKIKIRPDAACTLQNNDWHQMTAWLADLRDDGAAGPPGDCYPEPPGDGQSQPDGDGDPRKEAPAGAEAAARARAEVGARAGAAERAVIGDQLRMPIKWCQMGSCIPWHAHTAALGKAGTRARPITASRRIDARGRLACPRCQQTDPASGPPARSRCASGTWSPPAPNGSPPGPAAMPPAAPRPETAVTPAARPPRPPTRQSRHGTASTRRLAPCRPPGALIASQRLRSRGMVLDAARASRAYGGRRPHPAMPVSTARAW